MHSTYQIKFVNSSQNHVCAYKGMKLKQYGFSKCFPYLDVCLMPVRKEQKGTAISKSKLNIAIYIVYRNLI